MCGSVLWSTESSNEQTWSSCGGRWQVTATLTHWCGPINSVHRSEGRQQRHHSDSNAALQCPSGRSVSEQGVDTLDTAQCTPPSLTSFSLSLSFRAVDRQSAAQQAGQCSPARMWGTWSSALAHYFDWTLREFKLCHLRVYFILWSGFSLFQQ